MPLGQEQAMVRKPTVASSSEVDRLSDPLGLSIDKWVVGALAGPQSVEGSVRGA